MLRITQTHQCHCGTNDEPLQQHSGLDAHSVSIYKHQTQPMSRADDCGGHSSDELNVASQYCRWQEMGLLLFVEPPQLEPTPPLSLERDTCILVSELSADG